MKCKEAKAKIKRLERQNFLLQHRINSATKAHEERCYDFNLLEIVVRPRHNPTVVPIFDDSCRIDMRVMGCDDLKVPTICNYKIVTKAAIHLLKENRQDFIRHMGEIMARELLAFADENIKD